MALTERDIIGNVGALRVALTTLLELPEKPPTEERALKEHGDTEKNMKDTVVQCVELLAGGLINDVNRIANALEELCRQGQIDGK